MKFIWYLVGAGGITVIALVFFNGQPAWQYTQKFDPATGKLVSTASYTSQHWHDKQRIIVSCNGDNIDDLSVHVSFGEKFSDPDPLVHYRVDRKAWRTKVWHRAATEASIGKEYMNLFATHGAYVARYLMNGSHFQIDTPSGWGDMLEIGADLSGANAAISKVLKQCNVSKKGWPGQYPA